MRILEDKETGLTWYTPDIVTDERGYNKYNAIDEKALNDIFLELNSWQSENINEYILGDDYCYELGDFLKDLGGNKFKHFFAYDHGDLVASILMRHSDKLIFHATLRSYIIDHNEVGIRRKKGVFLPLDLAQKALDNDNGENNSIVEYFVVSPKHQGQGVGTRALWSVNHNLDFFTNNNLNSISTTIHRSNEASKKVFTRNNYLKPYDYYTSYSQLDFYFNIM